LFQKIYSIPPISQLLIFLLSFSDFCNKVIASSAYYIGFDALFDPSASNLFSFFLCTTTNGLLYSTSLDLKTMIVFTVYTPATTAGASSCSSISKSKIIKYDFSLKNNENNSFFFHFFTFISRWFISPAQLLIPL